MELYQITKDNEWDGRPFGKLRASCGGVETNNLSSKQML